MIWQFWYGLINNGNIDLVMINVLFYKNILPDDLYYNVYFLTLKNVHIVQKFKKKVHE